MSRPLITFCIATYNRGPVVLDCLKHVLANGLPEAQFEIRIIDNASTDNTPDLITREFPNLHLTRLPKNCGPVAKNIAMRDAQGEFLVLLDDDAYPLPGAIPQMLHHFREDKYLAAAVFDVTLPDGSREGSAYPDVFIGAGTGLRRSALQKIATPADNHLVTLSPRHPVKSPPIATLPSHFFMQAEEYDLSFRLLNAGFSIQRFWDLPLTHLKAPNARIGQRTTRLDVRNNLFLLAKYLPDPLCHQLAADWLARYFLMARQRDLSQSPHPHFGTHKQAFIAGAAQGLAQWSTHRANETHLLSPETVERIFKFRQIRERLERAVRRLGARRIIFAELGKNMLAFHQAAREIGVDVLAIGDDQLGKGGGGSGGGHEGDYRGTPLLCWEKMARWGGLKRADMVVITNISPVHAPRRAEALRRVLPLPVVDLFSRQDRLLHGSPEPAAEAGL
ncbi:MAG TPA: glycosyltransferase family 2 protein [Phycisphaerae bacterium]|nr:glycosyltransferase family 2 protein [Phycisphaerae bacterium]